MVVRWFWGFLQMELVLQNILPGKVEFCNGIHTYIGYSVETYNHLFSHDCVYLYLNTLNSDKMCNSGSRTSENANILLDAQSCCEAMFENLFSIPFSYVILRWCRKYA